MAMGRSHGSPRLASLVPQFGDTGGAMADLELPVQGARLVDNADGVRGLLPVETYGQGHSSLLWFGFKLARPPGGRHSDWASRRTNSEVRWAYPEEFGKPGESFANKKPAFLSELPRQWGCGG